MGLVALHFSSKDFEILDLDPPNNLTFHYGACHFGYNLDLSFALELLRHGIGMNSGGEKFEMLRMR